MKRFLFVAVVLCATATVAFAQRFNVESAYIYNGLSTGGVILQAPTLATDQTFTFPLSGGTLITNNSGWTLLGNTLTTTGQMGSLNTFNVELIANGSPRLILLQSTNAVQIPDAGELRFMESAPGGNYTAFKAGTQAADITYTLPTSAPSPSQVLRVNSTTPTDLEWATLTSVTGGTTIGTTLVWNGSAWVENTTLNGVVRASSGVLSAGNVNLGTEVTGTLPIANGGTGATTASDARANLGLAIGTNVQAWDADLDSLAALTTTGIMVRTGASTYRTRALVAGTGVTITNADGVSAAPTIAFNGEMLPSTATLNYTLRWDGSDWVANGGVLADNSNNLTVTGNTNVNGNLDVDGTATIGTLNGVVRASSGVLSAGNVNLTSEVTGTLPVANGGTNSSTALNNNRIMVSSGGAIIEGAALTDGQIFIGSAGNAPLANEIDGTTDQVIVTNGAGTITLSTPQNIATTSSPTFASLTLSRAVTPAELRIVEETSLGGQYTAFKAGAQAANITYTLPPSAPSAGQVLRANGTTPTDLEWASLVSVLAGTSTNNTLRWSGTAWVENAGVRADASNNLNVLGNLDVDGTAMIGSLNGVVRASSGVLSAGNVNLTSEVTGILPVANGGTNSSTALNNSRMMVSSGGAIVEGAALTNGQIFIGSTGNAPVANEIDGTTDQVIVTNGAGTITLSTPQNIATTSSPSFAALTLSRDGTPAELRIVEQTSLGGQYTAFVASDQTANITYRLPLTAPTALQVLQANATTPTDLEWASLVSVVAGTTPGTTLVWNGTAWIENTSLTGVVRASSGVLSAGNVNLGTEVTGVLPIANGGTNSSTALNNNRIMVSSGGAIVEGAALTDGQIFIGSTGNAPVAASLTGGNGITITPGAGSITIAADVAGSGTTGRLTRWTASNAIGDGSLSDNGTGTLSRTGDIDLNASATLNLLGNTEVVAYGGAVTLQPTGNVSLDPSAGDVIVDLPAMHDLKIFGLQNNTNTTNFLVMNGNDVEISTVTIATVPIGGLTASRNVRTNGSGGLTVGPIALGGGVDEVTGILPITNGGTGASDAPTARTNLGLAIGTNVQAWDADLDGLAALATNGMMVRNGTSYTTRTITGTGVVTVTNGDGISGNPTISLTGVASVDNGTAPDQTLYWDNVNNKWVANTYLKANGTTVTVGALNGVVRASAGVLSTGNVNLASEVTGTLPIANGGTGATDAATARTNLGLAIGTNVQAYSADLAALAGLGTTGIVVRTGAGAATTRTLSVSSPLSITNGDGVGGDPSLTFTGELLPTSATLNSTLYWNGSDWVANASLLADGTNVRTTGGLDVDGSFNVDGSSVTLTALPTTTTAGDLLTIDGSNVVRRITTANVLGSSVWLVGGNAAPSSGVIGISGASSTDLELWVNGSQAVVIDAASKQVSINNDLLVNENTTLGEEDADQTTIRGSVNINTTTASGLNVNINTSAQANSTTIGSNTASNRIDLNAPIITAPNILQTGLHTDQLVLRVGSGALRTATINGTTDQISINSAAGAITLSTPQNIATTSTPTFASMTLSSTSNQLTLGTTTTTTITAPTPAAGRTYTLSDVGANASFVMTEGAQTINGSKSFRDNTVVGGGSTAAELQITEASGTGGQYSAFKAGNQSANITYTLPTTAPTSGQVLRAGSTATNLEWGTAGGTSAILVYAKGATENNATTTMNPIDSLNYTLAASTTYRVVGMLNISTTNAAQDPRIQFNSPGTGSSIAVFVGGPGGGTSITAFATEATIDLTGTAYFQVSISGTITTGSSVAAASIDFRAQGSSTASVSAGSYLMFIPN